MRRAALAFVSLAVLAACEPVVPDSGAGVGFESYADYQARREAELIAQGEGRGGLGLDPQAVSGETSNAGGSDADTSDLADDAMAAIGQDGAPADPTGRLAEVENSAGISAENDFSAVSSERSIEQDAARVAANKEAYQVVAPTAIPTRPTGSTSSIVQFALSTTNSVGQAIYPRLILGAETRAARNCAKYPSPDLAQEDFLAGGGPERNVKGLDPDGDGFACSWDPAPFRLAARSRGN